MTQVALNPRTVGITMTRETTAQLTRNVIGFDSRTGRIVREEVRNGDVDAATRRVTRRTQCRGVWLQLKGPGANQVSRQAR
jgi:hypothetical protein